MTNHTGADQDSTEALYKALTTIFMAAILLLAALSVAGGDRISDALHPGFGFHPASFVLLLLVFSVSGKRKGIGLGYFPKSVWDNAARTITVLLVALTLLEGFEHFTGEAFAWLEPLMGAPGLGSYVSFWTLAGLTALHALDVHCPRNPARYLGWMNYALFFSVVSLCVHQLSYILQGYGHEEGHLYFEGLSALSAACLFAFAAYVFPRTVAYKMLFDPRAPRTNFASAAALLLALGLLLFLEAFFPRPGFSLTLAGALLLVAPVLVSVFRQLEIAARIARGEIREDGTSRASAPAPRSLDALLNKHVDRYALERGLTSLFFERHDSKRYGVQAGLTFLLAYGAILLSRTAENGIAMVWWANIYLAFNILIAKRGQYLETLSAFSVALLAANVLAGNTLLASASLTGVNATEGALIGIMARAVFNLSNAGYSLTIRKSFTIHRLLVAVAFSLIILAISAVMGSTILSLAFATGVFDSFGKWFWGSALGMFSLMPLLVGLILEDGLRYEKLTPKIPYLGPISIIYALGVFSFYAFGPTNVTFTLPHMVFIVVSLPLLILPSLALAGGLIFFNSIVYYNLSHARWVGDGPTVQIGFLMMLIPSAITIVFMARHKIARRYKAEQRALDFAPNALLTLDDEGRVLSVSKKTQEWFEVDEAALYGKRFLGFFENSKELAEELEEYFQGNPAGTFEAKGIRRLSSGKELVLAASVSGNRDASLPYSYVLSLLDVTKEHELEKEKAELIDRSKSVILVQDLHWNTLQCSDAWVEFTGHSREETLTKDFHAFLHPEEFERARAERNLLLEENSTIVDKIEPYRLVTKSGDIKLIKLRTMLEDKSEGGRFIMTLVNVTELEQARKEAEAFLNAGTTAYYIQNDSFEFEFVSQAACEFFGYNGLEEFPDIPKIFIDIDSEALAKIRQKILTIPTGTIWSKDVIDRVRTKSGEIKYVFMHRRWFETPGRSGRRLWTSFEDVTSLEEARQKADQYLKAGVNPYAIQDENFKTIFATESALAFLEANSIDEINKFHDYYPDLSPKKKKEYANELKSLPEGEVLRTPEPIRVLTTKNTTKYVHRVQRWFKGMDNQRLLVTAFENVTELVAARSFNEQLLDKSRSIILTEQRDHMIVTCSEAWVDLMGYSREETVGSDLASYLVPEQQVHFNKCRAKFLTGEYDDGNWTPTLVKKDGKLVYTKLNVRTDLSSDEWRVIHTIQDVTELQTKTDELERAYKTAEGVLSAGTNAYTVLDGTFKMMRASAKALKLFGAHSVEDLNNFTDLFEYPEEQRAHIFSKLAELPTGDVLDYGAPFILNGLDGTQRTVKASSRWFNNPTGKGRLLWTSLDDVTDLVAARSFNEALLDKSPAIILTLDKKYKIKSCSEAWVRRLGYSREETLGLEFVEFFVPEQRDIVRRARAKFRDGKMAEHDFVADLLDKDGDVLHVRMNARVDNSGGGWRLILTVTDITALEQQRRYTETLLNRNSSIILTQDENWKILSCSQAWIDQLGYSRAETIGHDLLDFLHPEDRETSRHFRETELMRPHGETIKNTLRFLTKAGETHHIEMQSVVGEIEGDWRNIVTLVDFTEIMQSQAQLSYLVEHDELTGLLSRRGMQHRYAVNTREEDKALYVLDIDHFKSVNDSFSHEAGDALLRALGQTMSKLSDGDGDAIRLGGEEFAIIRRWHGWDEAQSFGKRLCQALQQTHVKWSGRDIQRTASIGFAHLQTGDRLTDVLHLADIVAREAKTTGRNRVVGATESMMENLRRRGIFIRADEIQAALENGEMHYEVQPIWNMKRHAIEGFEALIRWDKLDGTRVMPALFIDLFYQVIREPEYFKLKSQMRRDCLAKLTAFPAQYVSFNYTLEQLGYEGAAQDVIESLESIKDHAERKIVIELSERAITARVDYEVLRRELTALQGAGCEIALDDFGVESSNLNRLQELPISIVKIDKALINDINSSEVQRATLRGLSLTLKTLGIKIIVEGVETQRQADTLCITGLHTHQGFLHAHPMPPENIAQNLAKIGKKTGMPPSGGPI